MISIAQYELSCNGDTTKILSKESSLCPICTEILTIETPDHEPFQVRQIVVGEKVAPKPKRKEIERIPVDHSRLLDAITEPYQDKQRRRAISYTTEIEKG